MKPAPIPKNEEKRVRSLQKLGLLDTVPEKRFDIITSIAAKIFHIPISTLTLVDSKREWFKSCHGLNQHEGDRAISFCGHALLAHKSMVIPDTKKDSRFANNPMVTGTPYVRFYAGVPIESADGQRIGVFCIKDTKPREFSVEDEEILRGLASWAEGEVNSHNLGLIIKSDQVVQTESRIKTQKMEELYVSRENAKEAMLNVMEDLEAAKAVVELEKAKDEAILASIGEGMIAVDNESRIIAMNKVAEGIWGWKLKDVFGLKITNFPLEYEDGVAVPLSRRPTTLAFSSGETTKVIYYFVRKDKTRFPIAITATPIKLKNKTIGLVEIIRDTTRENEIDKAKSEFVSLASHQLRTPLGIMKWYLEALKDDLYIKEVPQKTLLYFEQIYKSNERVLSLVRNLLSVSRIDQGRVKNDPSYVDVLKTIQEIVEQMVIIADKKHIKINLTLPPKKVPLINIDSLRFHEVIENLIANAIDYSNENGLVCIVVKKIDGKIFIKVSDNGIGMTQADKEKLFTKFFRSESAVKSNSEGSGLGLYVVKSYIDDWGGNIMVKSEVGKGSTFSIYLPMIDS